MGTRESGMGVYDNEMKGRKNNDKINPPCQNRRLLFGFFRAEHGVFPHALPQVAEEQDAADGEEQAGGGEHRGDAEVEPELGVPDP